ncbi:MAG: hypothetical protein J5I52_11495 [Saprospiraceae bacterium]|nr:MAG: hypothetical protein UZ09_BCD002001414 [Bacteroidetes bacterium OLB9]MCO6464760.1 hypothetical protein [Saprospiraceae bacterium]
MRTLLILTCLFYVTYGAISQSQSNLSPSSDKVFFIGEDEKQYEKMVEKYNTLLFAVCGNNMEKAFGQWTQLLNDIEAYASQTDVDIKGTKLWLNVFWAKDGKIDFIVFYPKPNSRNMNYDIIKNMLSGFISTYQSPLKANSGFSHYGSAAFPIFSKQYVGKEK